MNLVTAKHTCVGVLLMIGLGISNAALAVASVTYGFTGVSNTSTTNTNLGKSSLFVEVIDMGAQVAFKFTNTSTSSLTDVYFDDGTLLGIAGIVDSGTSVDFSQGASPPNLPGGNNLATPFNTTAGFNADSNPPTSPNGVTAGEWLTITFNLQSGKTYSSILSALAVPNNGGTGDLRIGLHVQSFANGGSESFVNLPNVISPVPEAQMPALFLAGLGLVGAMAVRRRKQKAQ